MIILDGAADRCIPALQGKTPLEAACKPVLDTFAERGRQALITIIDKEITPESDSGTMALLSYDPLIYYPGRGTLEGIGSGMVSEYRYFAAFRINFACYDSDKRFLDRRTARDLTDTELQKLADGLREKVFLGPKEYIDFRLIAFGRHRGMLCLVSNVLELSGNVSNTDPGFVKKGCFSIPVSGYKKAPLSCLPLDGTEGAKNTAKYINLFVEQAHTILEEDDVNRTRDAIGKMRANCILVRDGGVLPQKWPQFLEQYNWNLGMFGQLPSEKAIADLIGADFTYTKALELQLDENYLQQAAREIVLDKNDVVYIHLKGPDEPGHDRNVREKIRAIEKIDKYFMNELKKYISEEDIIVVTCDHATPCELGIHSADQVPLLICGSCIEPDGRTKFSEKDAALGGGEVSKAIDILHYIKQKEKKEKHIIDNIHFRYILNSNADKALEAEITLKDGHIGKAAAPSAILPGKREINVTDFEQSEVLKEQMNQLKRGLIGCSFSQKRLDDELRKKRKELGSDLSLVVSLAYAKAAAASEKEDLVEYFYKLLDLKHTIKIPQILIPVFSGGVHQGEKMDSFQQVMVCIQANSLEDAYAISKKVSMMAEKELKLEDAYAGIASSGGYLTKGISSEKKLELLKEILEGGDWKGQVSIAVDVAAEHLRKNVGYGFDGKLLTSKAFYEVLDSYIQRFSIRYIEDPFEPDATDLWQRLTKKWMGSVQIIGDDLFATQKEYVDASLATGAVVKMNQVGNLTDTLKMIQKARRSGMTICISHRSYETEDVTMCDLGVAASAEYIKIGGVKRGERIIKYNQLLRLEEKYKD